MRCRLILLITEHPIQQGIRKGGVRHFCDEDEDGRTDRMAYSRQLDCDDGGRRVSRLFGETLVNKPTPVVGTADLAESGGSHRLPQPTAPSYLTHLDPIIGIGHVVTAHFKNPNLSSHNFHLRGSFYQTWMPKV